MTTVLDHTIVPVKDQDHSARWYDRLMRFENLGPVGHFTGSRVNEGTQLLFSNSESVATRHFAFAMTPQEFDDAFERVKAEGIPYGDGPFDMENMKGPGMTSGARGKGKAVYFLDPDGHQLEIKTY